MVAPACKPSTWAQRQEEQEFKVIFYYTASLRSVWAPWRSSLRKSKVKEFILFYAPVVSTQSLKLPIAGLCNGYLYISSLQTEYRHLKARMYLKILTLRMSSH